MGSNKELQEEEYEVLKSIYEGDEKFTEINKTTFHYKFENEKLQKSFLIEFSWSDDYPQMAPDANLDLFCNKFLNHETKNKIQAFVSDQAEPLLGSGMLYTIIEALKEKVDEFLEENESINTNNVLSDDLIIKSETDPVPAAKQKEKKEQLTKAQKRRLLNRQEKGELPRGWNWVDIISHLSQTTSKDS